VLQECLKNFSPTDSAAIQFAPDAMTPFLRQHFQNFKTADLYRDDVDLNLDLRRLALDDESYDFLFASHVMEHVDDDMAALNEIYRVLKPGGLAILAVPSRSGKTIEYPEPVPTEHYHVRMPGMDYFDRYREVFDTVTLYTSDDFPNRFQPYVYEDRTVFPTETSPYQLPETGRKFLEIVPCCSKQ